MKINGIGPKPAKIMILGEAPGQQDIIKGAPFSGNTGEELNRMLSEAGIDRDQCYFTNVVKIRPPNNELKHFFYSNAEAKTLKIKPFRGLHPKQEVQAALAELEQEINEVRPNIIIALGNYAYWAVSPNCNITNKEKYKVPVGVGTWRGSILDPKDTYYNTKVIPIYDPKIIFKMWEWRPITVHDLRRALDNSELRERWKPKYNFLIRPGYNKTLEVIDKLIATPNLTIAVDLETRVRHIACIGIAWSSLDAICIPFMTAKDIHGYWKPYEEIEIVKRLRKLFCKKDIKIIGQNFAYDIQYITRRWGFIFELYSDTMVAQHVIFPGTPKALDYLASLYNGFYCYWKDEGKEWDPSMNEEQLWNYNCMDGVSTFEVHETQQKVIDIFGLREFFEFQMSMWPEVVKLMLRGVLIDQDMRDKLALELLEKIIEHERWFEAITKNIPITKPKAKPWYGSPQQQHFLFYDLLKQPRAKSRKSGKDSVDDECLTIIAEREPLLLPLVNMIKEYRSLRIFYKTFILMSLDFDGRARCYYNLAGPETYRLSSSEDAFGFGTNLQNIPKGNE